MPIELMIDELTFAFTPEQAVAIRAYVSRCEREFLQSLRDEAGRSNVVVESMRETVR